MKKIPMRFMGRLEKEPEEGGAWLVGYKIYFGDENAPPKVVQYSGERDSRWRAFESAEAGKRWLKREMIRITGKRVIKWYTSRTGLYIQGDVFYKIEKEKING
jgi:hypothetical protein